MKLKNTITREDGTLFTQLPSGAVVITPQCSDADVGNEALLHYGASLDAVGHFMDAMQVVCSDPNLTDKGKASKLEPLAVNTLAQLAQSWANVSNYGASLDRRFAAMVAVPQLLPGDFVGVSADRELRDYWRDLPQGDRMQLIAKMDAGPELRRLELALLRSPVPALADSNLAMVRTSWESQCRADSISEDVAIQAGRACIDVAQRGLHQLAAAIKTSLTGLGWAPLRMLDTLLTDSRSANTKGYLVFGWSDQDAAQEQRILQAKGLGLKAA